MQKETLYRNIGIMQEVISYGHTLQMAGDMVGLGSLLKDLAQLVITTERMLEKEEGHLISLARRCCRNLCASISEYHIHPELQQRVFSLEIVNLIWNLDTILHRQFDVLDHSETWLAYRKSILQKSRNAHDVVGKRKYKYKVTIFLTAYNKLEYTKAAVESIYRYTDFSRGNVELITINNGSTDGTKEYFESLPNVKKINYRENVLGVYNSPSIYDGEYRIDFANDIVATPHWLDNLLAGITSDDTIAAVVPVCGDYSISCLQGIHVEYENTFAGLPVMEDFAEKYNHSNPKLWEERAVLMPFIACWRREVLDAGIVDSIYTQAEFVDDDLSTTLRRTGWKQILLRDTYMHHFGGVTLNAARAAAQNNSLNNMRQVYYDKWGIDAWESRAMYQMTADFMEQVPLPKQADILWLEPLYGSSFLTLKQKFREANQKIGHSIALVREEQYRADAEAFFQQVIGVDDYETWLIHCVETYDIISMGRLFNELVKYEPLKLIKQLYARLRPNGCLLLPIQNSQGINEVMKLLVEDAAFRFGGEDMVYKVFNVQRLFQTLDTVLYPGQCFVRKSSNYGDAEKSKQLLSGLMSGGIQANWKNLYESLIVNQVWIGIQKPAE